MRAIEAFEPVANGDSKILILGTIPGAMSLEKGQYYAFKRNQFWKIILHVLNSIDTNDYLDRLGILLQNRIALWDVLASCERKGSLDSNIRNAKPNNFTIFFESHPRIRCVFFNGKKAHSIFSKKIGFAFPGRAFNVLPSTSPAYTIDIANKIEAWKIIKDCL